MSGIDQKQSKSKVNKTLTQKVKRYLREFWPMQNLLSRLFVAIKRILATGLGWNSREKGKMFMNLKGLDKTNLILSHVLDHEEL